MDRSLE